MRLPGRDLVATALVALGILLYIAWAVGLDVPLLSSASAVAVAVLVLGVAASASAVVPGFAELLRGSRTYLVVSSALGLAALMAGVIATLNDNAAALAALMIATFAMWALATDRHTRGAVGHPRPR
jgi:hypothetical protein